MAYTSTHTTTTGPDGTITVTTVLTPDTQPPNPPPPPPASGRTIAVYMIDGPGKVNQIPPEANQLRIAFVQGRGLVEWGGDTPAQTAAAITAWRNANPSRRVLLSVGGEGGTVDLAALPDTIRRIEQTMPVDGIDIDIEGGAIDVEATHNVCRRAAEGRGGEWLTAFTPPGGPPVARYLEVARRCQAAGLRVQMGSQLYDAEVSLAAALGVLGLEVDALGAPSVVVGMMIGADRKHWTVAQCETNMRAVKARWPDIGGCYLWVSHRPGTADWARRMAGVLA